MRNIFQTVCAVFVASTLLWGEGKAQDCKGIYLPTGECREVYAAGASPNGKLKSGNDPQLNITPPRGKRPIGLRNLYLVDLVCSPKSFDRVSNPWDIFATKSLTTSHVIAITNKELGTKDLPAASDPALITVYSVEQSQASQNTFINTECSRRFVISGAEPIFLAATANQMNAIEPTAFTQFIFSLIRIALPIGPILGTSAYATNWKDPLTAFEQVEKPINSIFAAFRRGVTTTKPSKLYEGKTTVTTPYSTVEITLSRIMSLVELADDRLLQSVERAVEQAKDKLSLGGAEGDSLLERCTAYANMMISRNFPVSDVAYALTYATRFFGLGKTKSIDCLSRDYALLSLQYPKHLELWGRFPNAITSSEVKIRFPPGSPPSTVSPKFHEISENMQYALDDLSRRLKISSAGGQPTPTTSSRIKDPLRIQNVDGPFDFEDSMQSISAFNAQLAKAGVIKMGCLGSDTQAHAAFLALKQPTGDGNKHKVSDAYFVRAWVDESQSVVRLKFLEDPTYIETLMTNRGTRNCGGGVAVEK